MSKFEISGNAFAEAAERFEKLGGDLRALFTEAMTDLADDYAADTLAAIKPPNLPAQGRYSRGQKPGTLYSAAYKPGQTPKWSGTEVSVNVGFDMAEAPHAAYLIHGTPKMAPDARLHAMYHNKTYAAQRRRELAETIQGAAADLMREKR